MFLSSAASTHSCTAGGCLHLYSWFAVHPKIQRRLGLVHTYTVILFRKPQVDIHNKVMEERDKFGCLQCFAAKLSK